jgi:ubiquinone/menaquinone biosynthesis C-methylase UbiE
MQLQCAGKRPQDKFRGFWDRMAQHYPMPFDGPTLADTLRVLTLVKGQGVEIAHRTILDIGCGTGICTLPLAREAAMVTGLDDSEAMLARMIEAASVAGIQNVGPVTASWKTLDPAVCGFEKAFDIAWVSMSPAVQTLPDFEKMERCARRWCVYIGWGRKRKNDLMEEIFRLHSLPFGPPPGVEEAYDILVRAGRAPCFPKFFDASWEWKGTVEDALEEMAGFIMMHGGRPRHREIEKVLSHWQRDGRVCHTTEVEEGLMVWPVQHWG